MKDPFQIINDALHEATDPLSPSDVFWLIGRLQEACGGVPRSAVTVLATRSGLSEARFWGALTAYPHLTCLEGE
jgi:hypothetical protein